VEYYIMDCNHGVSTGGSQKGTVSSDGSTYQIWEHQQVNQPSIQGTSTFNQYISINNACTQSGTITVNNHFQAWSKLGMSLGTLNYQVIAVESWNGAGSATQSVTNDGSGSPAPAPSTGNPSPAPAPAPSTGSTGSTGGSCSALWGQCGGQGWSGPTCCSTGTCHSNGQYYSQCVQ
jgi:endo-1,4-beta-xylanase